MDDCIFCKIIRGEIPSSKVYEDEQVLAFNDIDPKAPVHVLIIPKKHFDNILTVDGETMEAMLHAVRVIAKEKGVDESGFRIAINTGADGGQSVNHLHMHMLGKRSLEWPPG